MPIQYHVNRERKLVLASAHGTVTGADFRAYVGTVLIDPDVRPGFCGLFDARRVTRVAISIREMTVAVGVIQAFSQQVKDTRTALVASPDNVEEIAQIYELLRVSVPATVRLFNDMAEAQAWLGLTNDSQER